VRVEDEDDALSAAAEFADSGFEWSTTPPNSEMPWAEYVALLREWEQGRSLPEGWVPATTRFAIVDGRVAGRLSVRHELNEFLTLVGGHIVRELDLASALVTCKESNVGSATVIERGGGILRDRVNHPLTNKVMRRYDISL
jgi:predicted acetyltransferase